MSTQKEFKFHVIQLLDPPYKDFEKYVCVPNSWIRLRETSDGPALVKLPVEGLSEMKKRVERQEFSENWTVLLAFIKYSTNSYKEARKFIKILNKMMKHEQNRPKIVEDLPSTSDKTVVESESDMTVVESVSDKTVVESVSDKTVVESVSDKTVVESQSSSETNEALTASNVNNDAEPVVKEVPMQIDLTNDEVRTGRENSNAGTSKSPPTTRRYLTRQALKMSLSANNTVTLPEQTAKEDVVKTSHCVEENVKTKNNPENPPSANTKDLDPELVRKLHIVKALRSVLGDNFKETLEKLHSEFSRNKLLLDKMQLAITKNCQTIEQFIELTAEVSNSVDISDLDTAVKELETGMKGAKINENNSDTATGSKAQNVTGTKKKKAGKSDGTEVKNKNPVNKIRGQARKFTYPPEFDPNDSRWTLKHREKTSSLVELLPNSRIYIDALQLSNTKMLSKDSKTLARMLLLEIFTENALSICSFTGKKPNAFDFEGTSVRPGLDENARTSLLSYVKQHAAEQKWAEYDSQLVVNTIRNKMHEIRGKHLNVQK